MNKNKNFTQGSISTLLRTTFEKSKMVSVKNTKMFLTFVGSLSFRVILLSTLCSFKSSRARVNMIHNFARYLILQNKKKGPDYVIAYLKASQLALSKYLAGEPVGSLQEINPDYIFPRLASGLPKIIGPRDRTSLRFNNRKVIIMWMSIFGIFRVLAGTYKLKLSTISNPFSGSWTFLEEKSVALSGITEQTIRALPWGQKNFDKGVSLLTSNRIVPFTTSSPSSKVSWKGLLLDTLNLYDMDLYDPIKTWLLLTNSPLGKHFINFNKIYPKLPEEMETVVSSRVCYYKVPVEVPMSKIFRLRAEGPNLDAPLDYIIVPTSSLLEVPWPDHSGIKKANTGFCYRKDQFINDSPNLDEPYVISSQWIDPPYTVCAPYSKDVADKHEVLFITEVSTKAEIEAVTTKVPVRVHLSKNEHAVGAVGQLQFVKEPAGKLRTFAMVDVWTQSIMHPLHRLLTDLLRSLPNDGTLDQNASYRRAREKSITAGCSYGYDLSAATDRLPIDIQVSILRGLFKAINIPTNISVELSMLWKTILVHRPFKIPKLPSGVEDPMDLAGSSLYYEVGQPMGALSSFNMLALTHHMVMQDICQSLPEYSGKGWCEEYEITGDDISIFNPSLAKAYVEYMALLGLEINQKKSVVSIAKATGEYLKKTWIKNLDVSMISWKQLYQNSHSLMGRCTDALYFLQKWDTAKLPVQSIVFRAVSTWDKLRSPLRSDLSVPLLALLSIALRQKRVPITNFLTFLFKEGVDFDFKDLYRKVSGLKPNLEEVSLVLKKFFAGESDLLPSSASFLQRTWALQAGPLQGIHKRLVNQIMTVQLRLHGEFAFHSFNPDSPLDRDWSWAQPQGDDLFGGFMSEQGSPLFRSAWSQNKLAKLCQAITGVSVLQGAGETQSLYFVCALVEEGLLLPEWKKFCKGMQDINPYWNQVDYMFDRKTLREYDIDQLIRILEGLISLETILDLASVEDEDRRISHKVSLRVLSTLKPGKDGTESEMKVAAFWKRVAFVFDEGPSEWSGGGQDDGGLSSNTVFGDFSPKPEEPRTPEQGPALVDFEW